MTSAKTPALIGLRIYVGLLLVISGVLAVGGAMLLLLGGLAYYVLTGAATIVVTVWLWREDRRGALLYGAMLAWTTLWTLWESGLDGWALALRLIGPYTLGLLLLLPGFRRQLGMAGRMASRPVVVNLPGTEGGSTPAVIVPPKRAETFLIDRRTSRPIAPAQQSPVPQGTAAGDHASKTQPFSAMPSVAGPALTEKLMWGLTPIDQLYYHILSTLGTPNPGGSLRTRNGLLFIGATQERAFRAIDAEAGRQLSGARLATGAHAAPMSYRSDRTDRQYILIAAGGKHPSK